MQKQTDLLQLGPLQRVILIYNGTLTKLLENLLGEQLTVVKIHEIVETTEENFPYLDLQANQPVIHRKICLQGQDTGTNWLYAESTIVLDRLPPLFRQELLESKIPIGKLWAKHRVETFKELLPPFEESAGQLGAYFNVSPDHKLLGRTYRVFSNQQPIMMLTEKFPAHYFKDIV
ncbi:MAG: chorismate pyruvate-lyase family protein [Methylococcales bacterium]|nr:chorismate pyruvate-lyase family protein [Methylococcales bacterium]